MEGEKNELSDWGYNRDKKKGKKQVVVGLLCDKQGYPVSVDVFKGNTRDNNTLEEQIKKVSENFGCKDVTFVGDKGMIKSAQILQLKDFHYIASITKAQIDKLIKEKVFSIELFDDVICEIDNEGIRYILRRNPKRAYEIKQIRHEKKKVIEHIKKNKNTYMTMRELSQKLL